MIEVWRSVVGYNGLYEVSNFGRVMSVSRRDRFGRNVGGVLLRPQKHHAGYLKVSLSRHGYSKQRFVHQLVLEAFVGLAPGSRECRHLDGDPSNNRLENLRWGTSAENYADRVRHGTCNAGERHPAAKLCELDVWLIRNITAKQRDIAKFFDVSPAHVCKLRKGLGWGHVV